MPPRRVPIQVLPGCRGRVPVGELRRVARYVLDAEGVAPAVEVEVVLADDASVRQLNRLYRGRDESTDVLSFAEQDMSSAHPELVEGFVAAPDEAASLGEVVICVPFVERALGVERQREGARLQISTGGGDLPTIAGQVAHLLVHGLLHVLGYDHEASEPEAMRMQAREESLLASLGYDGLYEHGH